MFTKEDLCRFDTLPNNWWYFLDVHGQGQCIKFPLKIKPILGWTPAHQIVQNGKVISAPRVPQEKLCIHILKRSCDVHNLFGIQ